MEVTQRAVTMLRTRDGEDKTDSLRAHSMRGPAITQRHWQPAVTALLPTEHAGDAGMKQKRLILAPTKSRWSLRGPFLIPSQHTALMATGTWGREGRLGGRAGHVLSSASSSLLLKA